MNPTLIELQEKQIPLLLSFMNVYYTFDNLEYIEKRACQAIKQMLQDEKLGKVWLIEVNNVSVGYIILAYGFCVEFHGKTAVIDEFFINDEYRGSGLGSQVLLSVEIFCRKQNIKAIRLEVEYSNKRAQGVYEKAGFQAHQRYLMSRSLLQNA